MRRGFGVVGVAAVLTFAVPLTTASAGAEAPILMLVQGAVRAAAPAAAASIVGGPGASLVVGTVATVGALLYMTKDTWVPWVQGALGQGGPSSPLDTVGGQYSMSGAVDPSPGGVWSVTASLGSASFVGTAEQVEYQCATAAGVLTGVSTVNLIVTLAQTQYGGPPQSTVSGQCPAGGSLHHVLSKRYSTGLNYPVNQYSWARGFSPLTDADYDVNVNCRKADGTLAQITATTPTPGAGNGLLVPSCAAAFGADAHGESIALRGGQTGQPKTDQWSADWTGANALYPDCQGAGVACTYVVKYLGNPCVAGAPECAQWALRSQIEGNTDYSCYYGPYLLNLSGCAISERAYEITPNRLTKLNTDGNPDTYEEPRPAWVPSPAAVPNAPPVGAPGGAPAPIPGGAPLPAPTGVNENTDCWPSGVAAWNPAEWVLRPVKCALAWAFVPQTATVATLANTATTNLTAKGFGPIATAVGLNINKIGTGSGCDGPAVTFSAVGVVEPMHPFSACTAPMSTLASISYAVTSVIVVLGGGWGAMRAIGAGFGFNMSMGKDGTN
jgi:hypothetical protein